MSLNQQKQTTYLSAIDLGSGSLKFKIVSLLPDKSTVKLRNELHFRVPLVLDKNQPFHPAIFAKLLAAVCAADKLNQAYGVQTMQCGATSFYRQYADSKRLFAWLKEQTNITIPVLSGMQEAQLMMNGVLHAYAGSVKGWQYWLLDIGSGSTELAWANNEQTEKFSFEIGAVSSLHKTIPPEYWEHFQKTINRLLIQDKSTPQQRTVFLLGGGAKWLSLYLQKDDQGNYSVKNLLDIAKQTENPLKLFDKIPADKQQTIAHFAKIASQFFNATQFQKFVVPDCDLIDGLLLESYNHWKTTTESV